MSEQQWRDKVQLPHNHSPDDKDMWRILITSSELTRVDLTHGFLLCVGNPHISQRELQNSFNCVFDAFARLLNGNSLLGGKCKKRDWTVMFNRAIMRVHRKGSAWTSRTYRVCSDWWLFGLNLYDGSCSISAFVSPRGLASPSLSAKFSRACKCKSSSVLEDPSLVNWVGCLSHPHQPLWLKNTLSKWCITKSVCVLFM